MLEIFQRIDTGLARDGEGRLGQLALFGRVPFTKESKMVRAMKAKR
jgi:hypothetical protein